MGAWAVVLTAADERGLAEAEIAEAGARLRAPATRLGPASAEVLVDAAPALGGLAEALDAVDVNAVPVAGRRKRLLIADMDSTMIGVECIDEMAARAGIGEAVAEITERAMAGALDFEGALRARVRLVAGMSEAMLEGVMADRIRLNPGARVLVRTMAAAGAHTMLVSGGFTWFTERVAGLAGFAEHRANRLIFEDGRLSGAVAEPILGREAKAQALAEGLARHGLAPAEALAVGDGANDLAMIRAAGLGVGFRPKPLLAAEAGAVIRHSGLDALLALQGYRAEAYAA